MLVICVFNSFIVFEFLFMVEVLIVVLLVNVLGLVSLIIVVYVMLGLGGLIDVVVDGGLCMVGLELIIIGCFGWLFLLCFGGVLVEVIEVVFGVLLGVVLLMINVLG